VTTGLLFYGALGLASTLGAFVANRRLFGDDGPGRASGLEALYYTVGVVSLLLGWYFNVRYVHLYGHRATYAGYARALFTNWASDSAAQDYIIVNVVLFPLWSIVDGRRRHLRQPWIFFVMSLFTSLAFSVAFFLGFMERQRRYNQSRVPLPAAPSKTAYPQL
jgi:hypothetical protein